MGASALEIRRHGRTSLMFGRAYFEADHFQGDRLPSPRSGVYYSALPEAQPHDLFTPRLRPRPNVRTFGRCYFGLPFCLAYPIFDALRPELRRTASRIAFGAKRSPKRAVVDAPPMGNYGR